MGEDVPGNIERYQINRIGEVILTTRDLTASQIIELMHQISGLNVLIKISPFEEKFITGSEYVFPENLRWI